MEMCFYCCLSSILKYSVVLLQSRYDLEDCGRIVTIDIALLLKKFDGSATDIGAKMGLCQEKFANLKSFR